MVSQQENYVCFDLGIYDLSSWCRLWAPSLPHLKVYNVINLGDTKAQYGAAQS